MMFLRFLMSSQDLPGSDSSYKWAVELSQEENLDPCERGIVSTFKLGREGISAGL